MNDITDETLKNAIEKVLAEKKGDLGSDRSGDPRPTDAEVFFAILPGILGGYAGKSTNSRDAISSSFLMAREAIGQCCIMGIARPATVCTDGSHLAIMPQQVNVPGVQGAVAANQDATKGVMMQQYPSPGGQQVVGMQQPGPGGMVAQYPTVGGPGGAMVVQGGPIGQQNGDGRGMRAVVVAMVPNDPNVHPIAQPQQPPPQQGFPQQPPPQYPQQQPPPPGYR